MDWLTPQIFIEVLLVVIMGLTALIMKVMFAGTMATLQQISNDLANTNILLVKHISNHEIHKGG